MRVGVLEILRPERSSHWTQSAYAHYILKQYASVMPQAISVWCRQLGHESFYATYYGQGDAKDLLPSDLDLVFISTYTQASALAYALAKLFRREGTLTVIGGPHSKAFPDDCRRFFDVEPVVVGSTIRTGMRIRYEHPNEVGADRIVDAIAARDRHGPPPLIIVDFGTATVFDAIDANGDYLGGAIAPGVGIAAEALFSRASRLARVELERPAQAIGRTTTESIQSGILFGYVGLVEGIIARFKAELGGGRVVGTGGWADRIARETRAVDVVDQDLSLWGLRRVYQLNAEGTP